VGVGYGATIWMRTLTLIVGAQWARGTGGAAAMMQSASVVLLFQDKPVAGEGRIQRNFIAASDVWRDNLPLFLAWFGAGR
jgi:hypothetical protein